MAPRQTASALSVGNAARPDAALLLRVSGPDHPGITADLMALLGVAEVDVQDVEQVLVRGHLTLAVAVADPGDGGTALAAVLEQLTRRHDVTVSVVPAPAPPLISDPVEAVTVLGHELAGWVDGRLDTPDALDLETAVRAVSRQLARNGATDDLDHRRAHALGIIARSQNMSELARRVGMSRDGLYKALSADGNPTWSTILKVTNALGLRFELHAVDSVA